MTTPIILTFDVTTFRVMFPVFASSTTYPDAVLQMYWDMATSYVSNVNYGWLQNANRQLALNLMTAHLAALGLIIQSGQVPNLMQSSTIDKISIAVTPPPIPNQWQWWLNQTGYGQQLLALLQAQSAGGFYVGGSAPRIGFRNTVGGFGGGFGIGGFGCP